MEEEVEKKLCPYCDEEMEEFVTTGPFGRPIFGWTCYECGTTFDEDLNVLEESHMFDDDFDLANKSRGYDLDDD